MDPHLTIMPLREDKTSPVITTPNEVPINQTDLGSNVNVDSKAVFEKRRPWGKDSDLPEEDWPDPEIWFSFVISSDEPPEDILERIRHEWKKSGDNLSKCKWDKEKKILTTPEDEERAKEAAMQNAAWYKNDFGTFMDSPQKKKGKGNNQVDPEHIYDLDGTHSVKTIRERPGKGNKYGGSPGAPTFQIGGEQKQKQTVIELDDKDEEMDFSELTRDQLITRLQKASISRKSKGSAPTSENEKSHSDSEEEESTSADDGSSGSDDSGSPSGSSAEQSNESQNGADSE